MLVLIGQVLCLVYIIINGNNNNTTYIIHNLNYMSEGCMTNSVLIVIHNFIFSQFIKHNQKKQTPPTTTKKLKYQ